MAGSDFDYLEDSMMDAITDAFGYSATWTPSAGGNQQTGAVLFNKPTAQRRLQQVHFEGDDNPWIEYKEGTFPGLSDAVKNTRNKEIVNVDGTNYICRSFKSKYDGKTIIIYVEKAP